MAIEGLNTLGKSPYSVPMHKKVLRICILSLLISSLPSNFHVANSVDILWNPGVSNDLGGTAVGLVPGAGIRNTGLLVYKSNPDELIMKIIMNDSFEDKPFTGKGRNMAMWIYWPKDYCWGNDVAKCDGLFTIGEPFNPSSYPTRKSTEHVLVYSHNKVSNLDVKPTSCKAPWWIDSTYIARDTWSFAVSITCLGIPKQFGWYAFSQINLGQKDVVSDFSSVQMITNPFHELAASAAAKVTQTPLEKLPNNSNAKQVCVVGTTEKGFNNEQCVDSRNWIYTICDVMPRADLQVFKNKKWTKVKTFQGVKNLNECPDGEEITGYHFYRFTGAQGSKYRIKTYGNKKYVSDAINLKITTRNVD